MLGGTKVGKNLFVDQFNSFVEIAKSMLYDLFEIKKKYEKRLYMIKGKI